MPSETALELTPLERELFGEAKKHWGWLLGLGIVFLVLGLIGLGLLAVLTMASVLLFGVLVLVGGVLQFAQAFAFKGGKTSIWNLLMALLYLIVGVLVILNPLGASVVLTLLLAIALIIVGVFRIVLALQMKAHRNWIWPLIGGIITVLLGVLIWATWPGSGLWVLGMFVAVELIVQGFSTILVALAAKQAAGQQATA
jgi:uncharacterized membrane protein HdeD (DUF308 family)